jgi:glycosyltransferase involved in cell wall biosynthesis
VGSIEIRKNGLGLLNAWDEVAKARPDDKTKLVFAGRIGWLVDDFLARLASSPSLRERVILLTSPSDADLAWLYGHCLFTIYPSRYEGWGLPVGESLWFGKPCLASRASSIPEVGGDLIDYFDPESITDMAECITKVLSHPEALQAREQRIRQAALRSWADLSEAVYSAVIESPPT